MRFGAAPPFFGVGLVQHEQRRANGECSEQIDQHARQCRAAQVAHVLVHLRQVVPRQVPREALDQAAEVTLAVALQQLQIRLDRSRQVAPLVQEDPAAELKLPVLGEKREALAPGFPGGGSIPSWE